MTQAEKIAALLQVIDLLIMAAYQNTDTARNEYLRQAQELKATIV